MGRGASEGPYPTLSMIAFIEAIETIDAIETIETIEFIANKYINN